MSFFVIAPAVPAQDSANPEPAAVAAQDAGEAEPEAAGWFRQHFRFGGRLSVAGNDLVGTDPFVQATSSPALRLSRSTEWNAGRIGGGPSFQFRVTDRLGLAVDLVYRRAGYTFTEERIEGVDLESTTSVNEQKTISTTETTRVKYWDIPVLARLYFGRRGGPSDLRRFIDAGMTVRRVGGVRTTRNIDGPDDDTSNDTIAPRAANRNVLGWVAGAGVQATDDFGLTLMPEVRYTHWLRDTFASTPARPNRNQLEFLVGITF
ncbi:MAG TPA: porin family protein [Bryobacteraceae bacterium]|nr:porin family protein [Bryobacteraceae bacterium]